MLKSVLASPLHSVLKCFLYASRFSSQNTLSRRKTPQVFALTNDSVCLSSPTAHLTYMRDGPSDSCTYIDRGKLDSMYAFSLEFGKWSSRNHRHVFQVLSDASYISRLAVTRCQSLIYHISPGGAMSVSTLHLAHSHQYTFWGLWNKHKHVYRLSPVTKGLTPLIKKACFICPLRWRKCMDILVSLNARELRARVLLIFFCH